MDKSMETITVKNYSKNYNNFLTLINHTLKGVGEMILSSQYRGHKRIHIRRQSKRELVKAIQELEKRGFECVIPVMEVKVFGKNFKDKARFYQGKWKCGSKDNVDSYEQVYYETIMRLKSE